MAKEKVNYKVKDAIEFLLERFKFERRLYLGLTIFSVVLILVVGTILMISGSYMTAVTLLVPTGLISISVSRILKMWSDCMELIKLDFTKNSKTD